MIHHVCQDALKMPIALAHGICILQSDPAIRAGGVLITDDKGTSITGMPWLCKCWQLFCCAADIDDVTWQQVQDGEGPWLSQGTLEPNSV